MKKNQGGTQMSPEELDRINLECDLVQMINKYSLGSASEIVKELLASYHIERKTQRAVAISMSAKS